MTSRKHRRRYKPPANILKLVEENDRFLRTVGYRKLPKEAPQKLTRETYNLGNTAKPGVAQTSDTVPTGGGWKRSVDDYRWKRSVVESTETIVEIEKKKSRIAPQCNKGAYSYVTESTDLTSISKKV